MALNPVMLIRPSAASDFVEQTKDGIFDWFTEDPTRTGEMLVRDGPDFVNANVDLSQLSDLTGKEVIVRDPVTGQFVNAIFDLDFNVINQYTVLA